jgi:hypothetical protein
MQTSILRREDRKEKSQPIHTTDARQRQVQYQRPKYQGTANLQHQHEQKVRNDNCEQIPQTFAFLYKDKRTPFEIGIKKTATSTRARLAQPFPNPFSNAIPSLPFS